jgi:hypothetical protein
MQDKLAETAVNVNLPVELTFALADWNSPFQHLQNSPMQPSNILPPILNTGARFSRPKS